MFGWKTVVAAAAALVVVSLMFFGGGIGGVSVIVSSVGNWFGSSPFGSLFVTPTKATKGIDFIIYSKSMILSPDLNINVTVNGMSLMNFKGEIIADSENKTITFRDLQSSLAVEVPIKRITINNLQIKRMSFREVRFDIKPNITGGNGSIDIYDFLGNCTIDTGNTEFQGNASRMTINTEGVNLEVK